MRFRPRAPVPFRGSRTRMGDDCRRRPIQMNAPGSHGTGKPPLRVVMAEDESLIRLDLVEMLREEGYDVVGEAADGAEAVRLVEEHRPDVAVLDVKMPGLDGLSAAEQIGERRLSAV